MITVEPRIEPILGPVPSLDPSTDPRFLVSLRIRSCPRPPSILSMTHLVKIPPGTMPSLPTGLVV